MLAALQHLTHPPPAAKPPRSSSGFATNNLTSANADDLRDLGTSLCCQGENRLVL